MKQWRSIVVLFGVAGVGLLSSGCSKELDFSEQQIEGTLETSDNGPVTLRYFEMNTDGKRELLAGAGPDEKTYGALRPGKAQVTFSWGTYEPRSGSGGWQNFGISFQTSVPELGLPDRINFHCTASSKKPYSGGFSHAGTKARCRIGNAEDLGLELDYQGKKPVVKLYRIGDPEAIATFKPTLKSE